MGSVFLRYNIIGFLIIKCKYRDNLCVHPFKEAVRYVRMLFMLLLIPFLAGVVAIWLYRHTGKKEILRLDFVQFLYAFVLAPAVLVWLKMFVRTFFLRFAESSERGLFIIDTFLTVLFLYLFAAVVIHSVTKSFELNLRKDPLYDIFEHSEAFHLGFTHALSFLGLGVLLFVISMANVIYPLQIGLSWLTFVGFLFLMLGLGVLTVLAAWNSNFSMRNRPFFQVIKLWFGLFFLVQFALFLFLDVHFDSRYALFWGVSATYLTIVVLSFLIDHWSFGHSWLERLHYKHRNNPLLSLFEDR